MHYNNPITEGIQASSSISVDVVKAFFIAVPAEHPMHYRPMVMTFDDNSFREMRDITANGLTLDHAALRHVSRNIISQSRQSQGVIGIDNGWGTQRFAFYILFRVTTPARISDEILTGYTDELGMSELNGPSSRVWNPNMTLSVNSHMRVHSQETYGTHGSQLVYSGRDVNQVLRPTYIQLNNQQVNMTESSIAMRPVDALTRLQVERMGNPNDILDTRGRLQAGDGSYGISSSRKNELSSQYLSKILQSYSNAYRQSDGMGGEVMTTGTAASYAREISLDSSVLFRHLGQYSSYAHAGYLTFGEMVRMFPYFENQIQVVMPARGSVVDNTIDTQGWGAPDAVTNVAYALSHTVPAILSDTLAVAASFTVHNQGFGGQPDIVVENLQPMFDSVADERIYPAFCEAILNDLIPELFPNNEEDYRIQMTCSLFGSSSISVSLNGSVMTPFTAPNYADGLTSSSIGANEAQLVDTALKTGGMLDAVFSQSPDPGIATRQYHY